MQTAACTKRWKEIVATEYHNSVLLLSLTDSVNVLNTVPHVGFTGIFHRLNSLWDKYGWLSSVEVFEWAD